MARGNSCQIRVKSLMVSRKMVPPCSCPIYREDSVTKTNRGGLCDMKKECKVVWIKPNSNINRCPVRIIEKYIKLLPTTGVKPNLYLRSLKFTKPTVWYCETPLGINKVRSVVSEMLKDAGLDGYFTNHSPRRMPQHVYSGQARM